MVKHDIDLRHGDWRKVLHDVEPDVTLTDPPFSLRTHQGHNTTKKLGRSELGYEAWTNQHVFEFVHFFAPRTKGWFVAITSHDLVPAWEESLNHHNRYVFAPLPYVATGSRVRMQGDGPSCWTAWIVVARPRNKEFVKWGTLPGAYVLPKGHGEKLDVTGGKPAWLKQSLVRHYSKPGDLICDPCAGAATTLIAAAIEDRRGVGAEVDEATYRKAKARIDRGFTRSMFPEVA